MELEFIVEIMSADTGGGLTVDIIKLKDGRVIGVSDDAIVLYASMNDFEENAARMRPMIPL